MTLLRRIYRLVRWRISREMTRISVEVGKKGAPVPFGVHLNTPGSVVIVLPEDPLDALISVPVLLGFVSRFAKADVSLLCTETVAPFFKEVNGVSRVLTYVVERDFYFSRVRRQLVSELVSLRSGLWLYLEQFPGPILTYLSVAAEPAIRAGRNDSELRNTLLNLSVLPTDDGQTGIERYRCLTGFFAVKVPDTVQWKTTKEAVAQVRHVLGENGISSDTKPAGIDVIHLGTQFGRDWTASLVNELVDSFPGLGWYAWSESVPNEEWREWLGILKIPVIIGLSASATAALVTTSTVFLSGKTCLYQISLLMGRPAIGLFSAGESPFCAPGAENRCLILPGKPDEQSVGDILRLCASTVQ